MLDVLQDCALQRLERICRVHGITLVGALAQVHQKPYQEPLTLRISVVMVVVVADATFVDITHQCMLTQQLFRCLELTRVIRTVIIADRTIQTMQERQDIVEEVGDGLDISQRCTR